MASISGVIWLTSKSVSDIVTNYLATSGIQKKHQLHWLVLEKRQRYFPGSASLLLVRDSPVLQTGNVSIISKRKRQGFGLDNYAALEDSLAITCFRHTRLSAFE